MSYIAIDNLVDTIEAANGQALTPEEREEVELWRKGRDLSTITNHPGWPTVLEMMQSYATDSAVMLVNMRPGDERIPAAQAVAFALNDFYTKFRQDVDQAIDSAKKTPDVMRRSLRAPMPPEAMY